MKLKNILIVVKDIEKSEKFYRDMFGLIKIRDFGSNIIMSDGLVLQDEKSWTESVGSDAVYRNNSFELYFEENDLEKFAEKLARLYPETQYLSVMTANCYEKRILRFYDPDGHIIEVGTDGRRQLN